MAENALEVCPFIKAPDEVLMEIFKYLDSFTLVKLKMTCQRFNYFLMDERFWRDIDMMQQSHALPLLVEALKCVHHNTKSLKVRGELFGHNVTVLNNFNITLAETFTQRVGNLSVLELRHLQINFKDVNTAVFPLTLKRLVFNGCVLIQAASNCFFTVFRRLVNLEEVGIEYCPPIHESTLAKLEEKTNLRWLSLRGISEHCSIGAALGSRVFTPGFKYLEYIDLSHTTVSNQHLWTISRLKSLKEVILERSEAAEDLWVTDRGVSYFGTSRRRGKRLEKVTLRNYKGVTNYSLKHFSNIQLNLVLIDVSGTSVTRDSVEAFKKAKPHCRVIAAHLRDPEES